MNKFAVACTLAVAASAFEVVIDDNDFNNLVDKAQDYAEQRDSLKE